MIIISKTLYIIIKTKLSHEVVLVIYAAFIHIWIVSNSGTQTDDVGWEIYRYKNPLFSSHQSEDLLLIHCVFIIIIKWLKEYDTKRSCFKIFDRKYTPNQKYVPEMYST